MNLELPHPRGLEKVAPRTAIGRMIAAWPVISRQLTAGKKPREVYEATVHDGLNVPYAQFRVYVHRLRKRELHRAMPLGSGRPLRTQHTVSTPPNRTAPSDPLHNLREQRAKAKAFEYDPFPREGLTK